MFGKFVLSFLFFSAVAMAAQSGIVVSDESYIYLEADFDAKIIATVNKGESFEISNKTQGPFYRIRLKDKRLGWISSVDIRPANTAAAKKEIKKEIQKEKVESAKPLDSYSEEKRLENQFVRAKFTGPRFEMIRWREKTLGHTHTDDMTFLGWGWTGLGAITEAPLYTDASVVASFKGPDYYKKITGVDAKGWIVKGQVSALNSRPVGDNFLYLYGLGAVTTFSHLQPGIVKNGAVERYAADDITIGLVIPLGMAYRVGPVVAQAFYRFYFEKQTTQGFALGLNWVF